MVTNVSALGRNGLHDWVLLRASALVLLFYFLCIIGFIVATPGLNYAVWRDFFASHTMKIFTMLALLSLLIHAWIGMWQVLTDYVKSTVLRLVLQLLIVIVALFYLFYGVIVVWGA